MTERLVLVTSSFPIDDDGSEAAGSFVADLVHELARHVEIRVVAPGPRQVQQAWSGRTTVYRYAAPSRPLSTLKPWRFDDLRWIRRVWAGGLQATCAAVADGDAALLALWGLPCGEWARRAAHAQSSTYSVWLLGSDVWSLGRLPVVRQILARVIRQAGHAYADGYRLAEDARRIANVTVDFLPSTRSIQLADPPPPRNEPPYRLLFLGRWHPNKGVDLLLDALGMLGDGDWRRVERIEIHGGGPLDSVVRAKAQSLLDANRPLTIGGFVPKADAERAIVRADWVLIPSRIESIPVVFSDAIKLGRPVIATPVGDLPALVGAGCGSLSAAADASSFAQAIRNVLDGSSRSDADAMRACAARFSLEAIARKLLPDIGGRCVHE